MYFKIRINRTQAADKMVKIINSYVPNFGSTAITFAKKEGRFAQYFPEKED